ncbi:MAG: outer membrane protein heavy metal efflux system [Shewanella sp.]|jgi:cobalt-zinc-cadmium efflux system outer membrane protein|nr:outer membrane protein heavy metal efflux system [Shewanella sp.]
MKSIRFKLATKKPIGYRFYMLFLSAGITFSAMATESQVEVITLPDAVALTLTHHPDLKSMVLQERVMQGRIQQAGVGERPQIGLMIEDAMGTGEHSGFKSMQSTLTYSWLLQQQLIDSRVAAVTSESDKLLLEQQIKALDLSASVAKYFIGILVKQERRKLNLLAKQQAEDVVNAIATRVQAGKSSPIELQLAKAELTRRALNVEDIEHELKANKYQLASLWGLPTSQYQFQGDLRSIPNVPSVDATLAQLKQNPRLLQYTSAQRIAQSQAELASVEAKPQWQFSAGLRRYEASDDFGIVAGVSIPFGGGDRNAGKIAALKAQQAVLENEQMSLMQAMDAQLYVLLQEMAHSQHMIDTVQSEIVPTLENALTQSVSAFERGQLSYTQYSEVRRELLNAQNTLLDAYESLHLQHIEIQRLTGSSLTQ